MASDGRRGTGRRGFNIARLRRWLLFGIVTLVIVLAGLLGYARYRARRLLTELPQRLGADIKTSANGFTWSQSVKGRTVFTIHAAKAIQRQNGKVTLHDVMITLYGPQGSNRTDSIRGAEFEYDQTNGVIQADGEVHIDLASPTPAGEQEKPDSKRIEVTTSGLVFLQKLGVAATEQPIHIVYGSLTGGATGADYESDTGLLQLHQNVTLDGTQDNQPVHLRATSAVLDRNQRIATLKSGQVESAGSRATGDTMVLNVNRTGVIDHAHAQGHATIESQNSKGQGSLRADAPAMDAQFNGIGKLALVTLTGNRTDNVQFHSSNGAGSASMATLHFTAQGIAQQVDLTGGVHLNQTGANLGNLTADRVTAQLAQDASGHTILHDATATGNAILHSTETVAVGTKPGAPATTARRTTTVSADTLHAVTAQAGSQHYIATLDGTGNTRVQQTGEDGSTRTSTGDTLQAIFRPPQKPGSGKAPANQGSGTLQTAIQTGRVVVTTHTPAAPGKQSQDSRATASRAEFDAATQRLILTGSPQVTAPGLQLSADRITLTQSAGQGTTQTAGQGTGDAEAEGNVRGAFVQVDSKSPDPTHVLAAHAFIAGGGASARFLGDTGHAARLWTSTAQMDAPEIDLDRAHSQLIGISAGKPGSVHMTLPMASQTPMSQTSASQATTSQARKPASDATTARLSGDRLNVTQATATAPGHAIMTGNVRLYSGDSLLSAVTVDATLSPSGNNTPAAASSALGGSVQSVLATGDVRLQQPGRLGTGTRLTYTAADNRYVLTGTPASPPRVTDSQNGTVTGASLIFHGADDSVEVAGEPGHRVRTETQAARPAGSR